jgi:hypothetical protein
VLSDKGGGGGGYGSHRMFFLQNIFPAKMFRGLFRWWGSNRRVRKNRLPRARLYLSALICSSLSFRQTRCSFVLSVSIFSVCPSIYIYWLSLRLSVRLYLDTLIVSPFVCPSILRYLDCLSVCLSVYVYIYNLIVFVFVCPSMHMYLYCISVFLSLSTSYLHADLSGWLLLNYLFTKLLLFSSAISATLLTTFNDTSLAQLLVLIGISENVFPVFV